MPYCPRCAKPVYFAEKKTAQGKDWHRFCLKCAECNKDLSSCFFAEHNGSPYCPKPCYEERFGPTGCGHKGNDRNK